MLGESTPILAGTIPAFEIFMSSWEKASKDHLHLQHLIQPGLDLTTKVLWSDGSHMGIYYRDVYISEVNLFELDLIIDSQL